MNNVKAHTILILSVLLLIILPSYNTFAAEAFAMAGENQAESRALKTEDSSHTINRNEVTVENQTLGLAGVKNARQLGGYITSDGRKVRKNMLYRTGKLSYATPDDISKLKNEYNLGMVVDLRTPVEIKDAPNKELGSINTVEINLFKTIALSSPVINKTINSSNPASMWYALAKSNVYNENMYVNNMSDEAYNAGLAEFFQILLNNKGKKAVLWHCTSGKDRTGVAAALVLSALGVDRQTIIEDYTLANNFIKSDIDYIGMCTMELTSDPDEINQTMLATGVNPALMINLLNAMDEEYGSPVGYMEKVLGLKAEDIIQLQAMYLE